MKTVRIAVEGCCHGQLNKIYLSLPKNVDLLVICGDFQAIRNQQDLKSMNVPRKYLEMGDFPLYYLGRKKAPVTTIFIGGNHESSLYMRELQYGGWVAPKIYYLGEYGTVWYKGMRILGISGIYNPQSFFGAKSDRAPKYTLPYDNSTIRSIYHVKPKNFLKLLLSGLADIVLSHDWPRGIWEWGDAGKLLKKKPFLKADIENGRLGSPLASEALKILRPANWFSLHMHTFFEATVKHENFKELVNLQGDLEINEPKRRKVEPEVVNKDNLNEISLDMDDMDDMEDTGLDPATLLQESAQTEALRSHNSDTSPNENKDLENTNPGNPSSMKSQEILVSLAKSPSPEACVESSETYFMALDKCLPRRNFLSVKLVKAHPSHHSFKANHLYLDTRAIAINKVVENLVRSPNWASVSAQDMHEPGKINDLLKELNEAVEFEMKKISGNLRVPTNFKQVAPDVKVQTVPLQYWPNNQTKDYCEQWGVPLPDLEGQ
ncbi:lariat debranching enzyme [Metschnikowia aff. pulcherrima]|uniref:Lariat debranching enzyme n=1 Tax=Metschnikowia aff. pulcherrima TaxID=2163413 RepID=A0A4V1ADL9_9ASCO|nr:lariat debranching enzyme [Metschnikowia aff. pulcherrima]